MSEVKNCLTCRWGGAHWYYGQSECFRKPLPDLLVSGHILQTAPGHRIIAFFPDDTQAEITNCPAHQPRDQE